MNGPPRYGQAGWLFLATRWWLRSAGSHPPRSLFA